MVHPLPNLLFTRDSSAWIRDHVAVTSLAMPARSRETTLTGLIYAYHPRFAGTNPSTSPSWSRSRAGTYCCSAPAWLRSVLDERTTQAGVERLAGRCSRRGLAHTVLAVPIAQERATMHLDTICTMVDVDAILMYANVARRADRLPDSRPRRGRLNWRWQRARARSWWQPPRRWASTRLRIIDTGLDPVTAEREQWDDGNNTLAIGPRLAVAYERNIETNARLEEAGIEVLRIAGSELGSGRGGPRCMSCPISRDLLAPELSAM